MKQFRKWLKIVNSNKCSGNTFRTGEEEAAAYRAWKGALMWMLIAEWNTPDELTELVGKELLNE